MNIRASRRKASGGWREREDCFRSCTLKKTTENVLVCIIRFLFVLWIRSFEHSHMQRAQRLKTCAPEGNTYQSLFENAMCSSVATCTLCNTTYLHAFHHSMLFKPKMKYKFWIAISVRRTSFFFFDDCFVRSLSHTLTNTQMNGSIHVNQLCRHVLFSSSSHSWDHASRADTYSCV